MAKLKIKLPEKKDSRWGRDIEFFKSYDLHEIYGEEFVKHKTFPADICENMCTDIFNGIHKTIGHNLGRGDFEYNGTFYDQKTAQVVHKLPTGQIGDYFKVKYTNVNSKMFIQIVLRELDYIIEDVKERGRWKSDIHSRLTYIRYKTEINFEDMWFINEEIIKGDDVKSFCGRNNIPFLWFVNDLCSHNVKKFSNLIIFHPPVNDEQHHRLSVSETGYTTYKNHGNYMVTPIDINKVNVFIDYIGFGGFKVYVNVEAESEQRMDVPLDVMKENIEELDGVLKITRSLNNFKSIWNKNPWKPTHEYMFTHNWVEVYSDFEQNKRLQETFN